MNTAVNSLSEAITWLQTDDRLGMLYVSLAFLLLLELTVRVVRRFIADRRVRSAAVESNQRINVRMGRRPKA